MWVFGVYRSPLNDPLTYVRIWAHALGHENFSHYLNNFLLILLVGPMLEEKYGAKTLLITMLITALATGLLFVMLSPANYIMYGASGIVFMLILLSSYVNIKSGRVPITLILVAAAYIGREVYDNFYATDNISQTSHIIGGIIGAVAGFFINRKKFLPAKRSHAPNADTLTEVSSILP
jgi:GlpG protein